MGKPRRNADALPKEGQKTPAIPAPSKPSALVDTRDIYFKKSSKAFIPLTIREILDEQIAKKLA